MNCKLSVNINKIATLRNARGGNLPDVLKVAQDCERFGVQGITVHPRPDQRHIRYADVFDLCKTVTTEFNIEGYPSQAFIDLVLRAKPTQVTLVPDPPDAITSNAGWDTVTHADFLKEITEVFHNEGIRTSIFVNPDVKIVEYAAKCGRGSQRKSKVLVMAESEFIQSSKKGQKPHRVVHIAIGNSKRQILNTFHNVKSEFLQKYLDEFCYKFNRRYFGEALFNYLLVACVSYKNEYRYVYG